VFLVEWIGGSWQATVQLIALVIGLYVGALWLALVYWTYRDISQRSHDLTTQAAATLLVLFFFLPGHWIYLVMRPRYTLVEKYERSLEEEAFLQELTSVKSCPGCSRRVKDDFVVCPQCATQLKEPCVACTKPLDFAWSACPYCAKDRPRKVAEKPAAAMAPIPVAAAHSRVAEQRSGTPVASINRVAHETNGTGKAKANFTTKEAPGGVTSEAGSAEAGAKRSAADAFGPRTAPEQVDRDKQESEQAERVLRGRRPAADGTL
jgi:hypothetical protein